MGIFSDTLEDNVERLGQLRQGTQFIDYNKKSILKKPDVLYCHLCEEPFFDKHTLKKHIITKHANQHAYITVNGIIIQDVAYIKGKLDDIRIEVIGDKPVRVRISINGKLANEFTTEERKSFSPKYEIDTSGSIEVSLYVEDRKQDFIIYCGKVPEFKHVEIDSDAYNFLFQKLDSAHEPELEKFKHKHMVHHDNSLEQRYSTGLFSYALAFKLTQKNKSGKVHFETALSDLRPFATPFAVSAQRILALRMNFFGMLRDCDFPSKFTIANYFFNIPEYRESLPTDKRTIRPKQLEHGIFIDDYTILYLDALNTYYLSDWDMFKTYGDKLDNILRLSGPVDRNNHDKLLLLRARAARKKKDIQLAKDFYYSLITHPNFSAEAKEFCYGQ